ncbi:MAG TPA: cyclic peptide export ABC transporter [Polyangium sp.]|nr:cyclic peptide export ABC transporter [Polyangium sp.]
MTILDLIFREDPVSGQRILVLGAATAATSVLAIAAINHFAHAPETATVMSFVGVAITVGISTLLSLQRSKRVNAAIEDALHRMKLRLAGKVEKTDFERIEQIDKAEILDRLTQNMFTISRAAPPLSEALQSVFILGCVALYLCWLSFAAFVVLCVFLVFIGLFYRSRWKITTDMLKQSSAQRVQFLEALTGMLRGAKEIRLSRARRKSVLNDYTLEATELKNISIAASAAEADDALFAEMNRYIVAVVIAFVLPAYFSFELGVLPKIIAAVIYLWGRLDWVFNFYGTYLETNEALDQIASLEKKLDVATNDSKSQVEVPEYDPWRGDVATIRAVEIKYDYPRINGDVPFSIGPMNMTIASGEVIFIVGGNGSGKSTLLKVLCGLYVPTRGSLALGQRAITAKTVAAYREKIAAIFADYHLFSKAYGMLDAEPDTVTQFLREMQINDKTSFRNGEFSPRKLSTGQKKRIAMAIALFDDRPIFVLDEWAADQDPEFRKYFYEKLIPALKRKGKTVIAVSHDDRYFHIADRVITLEYGQIRSIHTNTSAPPERQDHIDAHIGSEPLNTTS